MKTKNNRWKKKVLLAATTVLTVCSLSACGKGDEEVVSNLFNGFGKNELFRINNASCTVPEYMVYLTNIQNQYEHVYGSEIWDVALGNVTLEDNVPCTSRFWLRVFNASPRTPQLRRGERPLPAQPGPSKPTGLIP